ncbi:MAG: hypothetical protein JSW08_00920 [archaeon]|nr:MAG: hypothetical protein JSW08_00920 [archaeon]
MKLKNKKTAEKIIALAMIVFLITLVIPPFSFAEDVEVSFTASPQTIQRGQDNAIIISLTVPGDYDGLEGGELIVHNGAKTPQVIRLQKGEGREYSFSFKIKASQSVGDTFYVELKNLKVYKDKMHGTLPIHEVSYATAVPERIDFTVTGTTNNQGSALNPNPAATGVGSAGNVVRNPLVSMLIDSILSPFETQLKEGVFDKISGQIEEAFKLGTEKEGGENALLDKLGLSTSTRERLKRKVAGKPVELTEEEINEFWEAWTDYDKNANEIKDNIQKEIEEGKKEKKSFWERIINCSDREHIGYGWCAWEYVVDIFSLTYGIATSIRLASHVGTCAPEQPLTESQCESCNEEGFFCTEERCAILGPNCITAETEDPGRVICISGDCPERGSPKIIYLNAIAYDINGTVVRDKDWTGGSSGGVDLGKIAWDTAYIELYVDTSAEANPYSEFTKCRWSFKKDQAFENMSTFDPDLFSSEHYVYAPTDGLVPGESYTIFIKCQDVCGAVHQPEDNPYQVKFELEDEPDWRYPCYPDLITAHDAGRCYIDPWQSFIPANLPEKEIELWFDEDEVRCRYSTPLHTVPLSVDWDNMTSFGQEFEFVKANPSPYESGRCLVTSGECTHANLTLDLTHGGEQIDLSMDEETLREKYGNNLTSEDISHILDLMQQFEYVNESIGLYRLMFVCRDEEDNEMPPVPYSLLAMPPYDIEIIQPPWNDSYETYERQPELVVNTSHNTYCKYLINTRQWTQGAVNNILWDEMNFLDEVFTQTHIGIVSEELNATPDEGKPHYLFVRCRDAGNLEVNHFTTSFSIVKDITPPEVIRMYHMNDPAFGAFGNSLVIETDDEASCVYSLRSGSCAYNFSDGTPMSSADKFKHSAPWQISDPYYIKCKDKWDNGNDTCAIIVYPYEVPEFIL